MNFMHSVFGSLSRYAWILKYRLTFKVLFTHHSQRFNKDYAVFYNEADENHLLLFSFDETYNLSEVNNPEEISELEEVLHKFDEENAN